MTTIFQKFEENILIESDHFDDEMTTMTTIFQKFEENILIESDQM